MAEWWRCLAGKAAMRREEMAQSSKCVRLAVRCMCNQTHVSRPGHTHALMFAHADSQMHVYLHKWAYVQRCTPHVQTGARTPTRFAMGTRPAAQPFHHPEQDPVKALPFAPLGVWVLFP